MELPKEWEAAIERHPELELREAFLHQQGKAPWEFIPPYFFHHFRPDGAGLSDFLAPFSHGDELMDRLRPLYELTSENAGDAYFVRRSPENLSDDALSALVDDYAKSMRQLLAKLGHEIELSPTVTASFIAKEAYFERYMETLGIEEAIGDYFGTLMSELEKTSDNPLYSLYADPLYYIACDYELAQYFCWPFVRTLVGLDDPFLPYFELWRHGIKPTFADEKTVWLVR